MQRALLHFHKPENADLVRRALRKAGREELIGYGPEALVPPEGRPAGNHGRRPDSPTDRDGARNAGKRNRSDRTNRARSASRRGRPEAKGMKSAGRRDSGKRKR